MSVYISLLHYPVYDKNGRVVSTAVTNLDIHDIARMSKTFGLAGYFLVTPVDDQREMVQRILQHWLAGPGRDYNPVRREAFHTVKVVPDLASVVGEIERLEGKRPYTVGTSAREGDSRLSFADLRRRIENSDSDPILLVLGTGWGLEQSFIESLDTILEPIRGRGEFNHLSVRSAAAIMVDRLLGR
jgi:hypothetical protein